MCLTVGLFVVKVECRIIGLFAITSTCMVRSKQVWKKAEYPVACMFHRTPWEEGSFYLQIIKEYCTFQFGLMHCVLKGPAVYTAETSNLSKIPIFGGVSTTFMVIIGQEDKTAPSPWLSSCSKPAALQCHSKLTRATQVYCIFPKEMDIPHLSDIVQISDSTEFPLSVLDPAFW